MWVFAIGVASTMLVLSQLATGAQLPSLMWFMAMLMGLGFGLILFGLLGRARRRSAEVRKAHRSSL